MPHLLNRLRRSIALVAIATLGAVGLTVSETLEPAHGWVSSTSVTIDSPAGWGMSDSVQSISPDGTRLYTSTSQGVVVYNLTSKTLLTSFALTWNVSSFTWNSSGTRLYATNGETMVVFDTSTSTPSVLTTVTLTNPVSVNVNTVRLSADNTTLYLAGNWSGSGKLVRFNTTTYADTLVASQASTMWYSMAINAAGTMAYVGSIGTNYIYPVTLSTGTIGTGIAVAFGMSAVAVSTDQTKAYFYSGAINESSFQEFNLQTGALGTLVTTSQTFGISYISNVALSGDGSTLVLTATNAMFGFGTNSGVAVYSTGSLTKMNSYDYGQGGLYRAVVNTDGTRSFLAMNKGTGVAGAVYEYSPLAGVNTAGATSGGTNLRNVALAPNGLTVYGINAGSSTTTTSSISAITSPYASLPYQSINGTVGAPITPTPALAANGLPATVSWTLSADLLNKGLSIDSVTGVVSGTPSAAGTFLGYAYGVSTSSVDTITAWINLSATSMTPSSQIREAIAGRAMSATGGFTLGGITGTLTYSISPSLPKGLSFDSSTGVVSGTPRVPTESTTYTIAVTGSTSGAATATSTLTLSSASVTPGNAQFVVGTVGTPITPTSAFQTQFMSGSPTWTTGNAIPTGLSLDSATGVISGTPTVAATWASVTLTGTFPNGSNVSRSVYIGVSSAGKSLSIPDPIAATIGSAITSTNITASGFSSTPTYSQGLTLPAGITVSTTGVISGTPTQPLVLTDALRIAVSYRATYSSEQAVATVPFLLSSAGMSLTMPSSITVPVGQAMTPTSAPANVGLTGPIGYWISPSLPTGLTMNAMTGVISGTPTAQSAAKTYTVTAIGSAETLDMATTTFSLGVSGTLTPSTQTINASPGVAITDTSTFTSSDITGTPTYAISPALPSGLSMSTSTGVISGTPTASQAATTYTITASGSGGGTATATVTIGVAGITPLTQTIRAVKGTAMTASTAFTATAFVGTVSYALTGTLPTGLNFNTSTGVISGTPSVSQSLTTYTVTAEGATSGTASATISLSVAELPPATTSVQGTVGTAITDTSAFTPVGMTAPITYSVSPGLPSGLTLNTSTGVISGTPTAAQANATYTITATDSNLVAATTTIDIQIAGLSPATQTRSTQVGTAITDTTALTATGFTGTVSYSVSPAVAAGLSFNTTTGVISGTPTTALAQQVYTITGTGTAGTATATVTITSATILPATQTLIWTAGSSANSGAVTHFGFTGTMSYSISPAAPAGTTFDTTTGVLSGTPTTAQGATNYTITATGSTAGTATATISLQVLLNVTPSTQRVLGQVGQALATQSLTAGVVSTSALFTVSPSLPAGLSISSSTGVISGTPTAGSPATDYTVTAIGSVVAGQTGTAVVTIGVNTTSVTLTPARQSVVGAINSSLASAALTPAGFVGAVAYSVSPALPAGLSISSSTGVISGTPTVAQPSTSYVISATGATSGTASAVVEIAVNSASVSLTPSSQSVQATENLAIAATQSLSASGLVGVVSYSVSPALPAGLSLNSSTGVVSGTPTVAQAAAPYVITGSGAISGIASATVTIGVASATASVSRPSQVIQAEAGQPITQSASIDASGLVGTVTYSITPQLPAGLSFDPTTGVISGTPVAPLNGVTFTITASGSTSGVASGIVTLTVASAGAEVTNTPTTVLAQAGQAITATSALNVSGMTAPVVYSVSPQLPAGLTIDPNSGVISGTPTDGSPATEYLITAQGAGGEVASAPVTIATASAGASASPATQQQAGVAGSAITATTAITPTGLTGTPSYTVTPALPDGLTIDSATGVISGTPTGGFVATSFVITGTGSGGGVLTSSVTLAASSAGASSSPAASVTTGTVGSGITPTTAPSVTGIGSPVSFQVFPELPAGLTLNTTTGVISGTPSATLSATTYFVSAVGPNGVSVIPATISFSSVGATMTPGTQTVSAQQGVAITQTSAFATSGLGSSIGYVISPALPTGLTLNASTGQISGTPASAQATTEYLISATGSTGSASSTLTVTVTGLTPGSQVLQGTVGDSITPTTSLDGIGFTGVITYSVSPSLPQGLTLNQSTGVISGTPATAQLAASYTVTGTDTSSNSGTATVSIQIAGLSPASQAVQGTVGSAITATTAFTATGFTGAVAYSVSPALPQGLSINANGVISGTPTQAQSVTTYTVTAEGASAGIAFSSVTIRVAGLAPSSQTVQGTTNTSLSTNALTPTGFNGAVTYAVSPSLPAGLTLGGSGAISGTPTTGFAASTFTITASGAISGQATATVSLQVAAVTTSPQTITASYGTAITPTATLNTVGFGGSVSYLIAPGLPSGLSMNQSTGVISGTPSQAITQTSYTITASGSTSGVATSTVSVTIASVAPTAPTGITVTPVRGQAVVGWTPGDTGGAQVTYTVTVSPGGATCVTTGTSCVVIGLTPGVNYTFDVTAGNNSGSASPAPSTPTVVPAATLPSAAPTSTVGTTLTASTASGQTVTTLVLGETYTVSGTGFAADSDVTIVFFSTPTVVGSAAVNAQGAFSTRVTVPTSLAQGSHTLVALGVSGSGATEANATVAVTVAEPDTSILAKTGNAPWLLLLVAAICVALGAMAVGRRKLGLAHN